MAREVAPQLGLDSFSCPHCGALAHQHWFAVSIKSFERYGKLFVYEWTKVNAVDLGVFEDADDHARFADFKKRFQKNEVTYEVHNAKETLLSAAAPEPAWRLSCLLPRKKRRSVASSG